MIKLYFLLSILFLLFSCQTDSKKEETIDRISSDGQRMLSVSYCDYTSALQTEDYITLVDAQNLFEKLPSSDGNFLSIVFNSKQVVQFMYQEDKWLAEITNDSVLRVFNQRYVTKPEALEIIKEAYQGDVNKLQGFTPVSIMTETLDDVINKSVSKDSVK